MRRSDYTFCIIAIFFIFLANIKISILIYFLIKKLLKITNGTTSHHSLHCASSWISGQGTVCPLAQAYNNNVLFRWVLSYRSPFFHLINYNCLLLPAPTTRSPLLCPPPPPKKKMASSATSTPFISSIAAAKSMATPLCKTLTLPNSFSGTRKSIQSRVPRSISLTRGSHSAKSFVVKASVS